MPKKILVVDDNLDTREMTHLHLTTEGANWAMNKRVLLDALTDDIREMLSESEQHKN